ncbi:MAG: DUF4403 family protein [Saprospiraceae bacterium]
MNISGFAQTAEPTKPVEIYSTETEMLNVSNVNIPVKIEAYELERTVNNRISGTLYEDYNYADGDGIMLKVVKSNWINVWFDGMNNLYYRVPVSIWFKKNLGFTEAEATGEIALKFKTVFSIKPDWNIETYTVVETYDWIQKPTLNTGWGIPVTSIANFAIEKNKYLLGQLIDKQVKESFDFKTLVSNAWNSIQSPAMLSQDYKAWMKVTPKSISMTPLYTKDNVLQTNISLDAITEVLIGKQPTFRNNTPLPALSSGSLNLDKNDFLINVHIDVPYSEIDSILMSTMKGQKFSQSGKTIVIEDIRLFGQNDKMIIDTKMSGDFKGSLYLKGSPVYDPVKREIALSGMDFELNTKNFFAKSANWLFHKGLVKMMENNLKIPVGEKLDYMRITIADGLKNYQLATGVSMQGQLGALDIEKLILTSNSIRIAINAKGQLNLLVKGLE